MKYAPGKLPAATVFGGCYTFPGGIGSRRAHVIDELLKRRITCLVKWKKGELEIDNIPGKVMREGKIDPQELLHGGKGEKSP
ncbi:hypothetical protein Tco_0757465 [Tanacetum coccineum]